MNALSVGFKSLWRRVRRGEALDLIAVVIVALAATILGALGLASQGVIVALSSTATGLLAIAFLNQRDATEQSAARVESAILGARFQQEPPFDYTSMFRSASVVYLAGLDLARTYSNNERIMREFINRGGSLRVLLYNHSGPAIDFAVMRSKREFSKERQQSLIKSAIEDFSQLSALCTNPNSGSFTVKLSNYPFHHGIVAADYTGHEGFICLKHYTFRADNYDKPWLRLTSADGEWYTQWAAELDALWGAAVLPDESS